MIRKANIKDFESYLKLKRLEEKDYSSITRKKIRYPEDKVLRKEFLNALRKQLILIVEFDNRIVAYMHGTFFRNPYYKWGYVEDIYVVKELRRKGIAKELIRYFVKILDKKGYKRIDLSVNPANVGAIKLYKKSGFKVFHWDLKKEWK